MDKLYSRNVLLIKAVFCVLLAPLYNFFTLLFNINDDYVFLIVSILPIGCLFTIPFWFSIVYIKKYRTERIGKYIAVDSLTCFAPALLGVVLSEIIYELVNGKTSISGVFTLIFLFVFISVCSLFWILYYIYSKKK